MTAEGRTLHAGSRRVLVTGAGEGIGRAIAEAFARDGARVALNDIDAGRAERTAAAICAAVGRDDVVGLGGDVGDVEAVRALVHDAHGRLGGLDVCVANAGVTRFLPILESEPDDVDRLLAVNLRGTWFTAQAAARTMVADGHGGAIVLISSVTGLRAITGLGAYGMTKAGIVAMARSLAHELGPHGIQVNAIAPGATLTERTSAEAPGYADAWAGVTPTGAAGTPEDVAAAVLALADPKLGHVTGQLLVVDGGWSGASPVPDGY